MVPSGCTHSPGLSWLCENNELYISCAPGLAPGLLTSNPPALVPAGMGSGLAGPGAAGVAGDALSDAGAGCPPDSLTV